MSKGQTRVQIERSFPIRTGVTINAKLRPTEGVRFFDARGVLEISYEFADGFGDSGVANSMPLMFPDSKIHRVSIDDFGKSIYEIKGLGSINLLHTLRYFIKYDPQTYYDLFFGRELPDDAKLIIRAEVWDDEVNDFEFVIEGEDFYATTKSPCSILMPLKVANVVTPKEAAFRKGPVVI